MLFGERLKQAISRAKRSQKQVAVMYIDLDGFKEINDVRGHNAGDDVLRAVAERLKTTLREADTVARLGGDEFAIVLEDISEIDNVKTIASSLVESVGVAIPIDGKCECVTPSIGISVYPGNATDPEQLVQMADQAMYQAKKDGKNRYRISLACSMTHPDRTSPDSASQASSRWRARCANTALAT
jgi:diguanylate cyclase (GGDEF)-like protein